MNHALEVELVRFYCISPLVSSQDFSHLYLLQFLVPASGIAISAVVWPRKRQRSQQQGCERPTKMTVSPSSVTWCNNDGMKKKSCFFFFNVICWEAEWCYLCIKVCDLMPFWLWTKQTFVENSLLEIFVHCLENSCHARQGVHEVYQKSCLDEVVIWILILTSIAWFDIGQVSGINVYTLDLWEIIFNNWKMIWCQVIQVSDAVSHPKNNYPLRSYFLKR